PISPLYLSDVAGTRRCRLPCCVRLASYTAPRERPTVRLLQGSGSVALLLLHCSHEAARHHAPGDGVLKFRQQAAASAAQVLCIGDGPCPLCGRRATLGTARRARRTGGPCGEPLPGKGVRGPGRGLRPVSFAVRAPGRCCTAVRGPTCLSRTMLTGNQ